MFLSSNENKNALVRFNVAEWKNENYRLTISSKSIFVTDGDKASKVNEDTVIAIRMMLHAQHASQHFQKILISGPDTDVFIVCLSFQPVIDVNLYFLTGARNSRRIIDIGVVVENINQISVYVNLQENLY